MVAGAFVLSFPASMAGVGSRNGVRSAIVYANTADEAKDLLKAMSGGDIDAAWVNADSEAFAAGANLVGWTLHVVVTDPDTGAEVYNVEVVGAGANDTVDEIAALMVTALEAAGGADLTPSYNSGTNTLTVAAIADDIGDHNLKVAWYPPNGRVAIPGMVGAIVDAGIAGAVLTAVLAADTYSVAKVVAGLKEAK